MKKIFAPLMIIGSLLPAAALADEGMWTFDNFPAASVKAKYGVTVDKAWLNRVQGAAVRLSTGCSASVVSGGGLILTNHHCVRDCAQALSSAGRDYVETGFMAAKREDEKLCPGMQAEMLATISDVTARVTKAACRARPARILSRRATARSRRWKRKAVPERKRNSAARW